MMLGCLLLFSAIAAQTTPTEFWLHARQDRYGTARAPSGPRFYTPPWVVEVYETAMADQLQRMPVAGLDGALWYSHDGSEANRYTYVKLHKDRESWSGAPYDPSMVDFPWAPAVDPVNKRVFVVRGGSDERVVAYQSAPTWNTPPFNRQLPRLWTSGSLVIGSPMPSRAAGPVTIGPDGDVYIATTRGSLRRLSGSTGVPVWMKFGLGPTSSSPVFTRDDRRVILSTGRAVRAFRPGDGHEIWRAQFAHAMGPAAVAENGAIIAGDSEGVLRSLDRRTGNVLWETPLAKPIDQAAGMGRFGQVLVSAGQTIFSVNAEDGTVTWSRELGGRAFAPSIGHDGRVYVSGGNDIFCFTAQGDLVWRETSPFGAGLMTIGPDATLYVATRKGFIIIGQRPFATQGLGATRKVSVGTIGSLTNLQVIGLTTTSDGDFLSIAGRRTATLPNAFARMWVSGRQLTIPPGFGFNSDVPRRLTFATLRARTRAHHGGPITLRVHVSDEVLLRLVLRRTGSAGSDWSVTELTLTGDALLRVMNPWSEANFVLTWEGSGDIAQSKVDIDLFEAASSYTFWPEPE